MKLLKYAHERSPDQGLRMGSEMKKKKQNHNTKPNQTTFWTQVSMNYQRWYEKVRHVATGFIWKHFHMSENATYWKKCLSNSMQTCNSKQKLLYKIVSLLCCVFLTCMHFSEIVHGGKWEEAQKM